MYHLRKLKCMLLLMFAVVTANAQLESGKVYNFVNVGNSGKSMVWVSGDQLSIADTNTSDYKQLWYVVKNDDNSYSLRSLHNGKYLRSPNAIDNARWTTVAAVDDNCKFGCETVAEGIYSLRATNTTDEKHFMHYSSANNGVDRIVCWSTTDPSQWRINEVAVSEDELEFVFAVGNRAIYQTALDALFADKSCTTPKKSLTTEEAIKADADYQALSKELQKMVLKVYLDNWAEDNYDANKSGWDAAYAKKYRVQLYEPYNDVSLASTALGLNEHTNMNNPTGIFSGAREVLYIMVEGEIKDGAFLYLDSFTGHNKLGNYRNGIQLNEGLNVIPAETAGNNYFINYVVETFDTSNGKRGREAKAHSLKEYAPLKIHIEGGYINGYWNKVGDALYAADTNDSWEYIEARATQTDVTVLGKYMTLQFPLRDEDTEQYDVKDANGNKTGEKAWNKGLGSYLNELVNIEDVINSWDNVMMWERLLLGVLDQATVEAAAKKSPYSEEPYVIELSDISEGGYADYYNVHGLAYGVGGDTYMYGTGDHSGYHYNTMGGIIQAIPTDAGSHWGPAHEIGHQHQNLLKIRKEMEVTNNLFSNVVLWYYGETTSRVNGTEGSLTNVLENFNKEDGHYLTNNIWAMTHMYYKLFLYYHVLGHNPQFYPRLFELLRHDPSNGMAGTVDGSEAQLHLYRKVCEAAGEDLTEFFRAYGFFKPLDGFAIDDYGVSRFYMTQEQIDEAIAEVKAWAAAHNAKENTAVLFINDATGETIKSHKGDNLTLYGETTVCAEMGSYATFGQSITNGAELEYTVSGKNVTVNAGGGVGYAIYNKEGEIIAFSDKKAFTVSDECASALMWGDATLKVINADNTAVEVEAVDEVASKYALLGNLIAEVEAEFQYEDAASTKVGYYKDGALDALQTAFDDAKKVYDDQDVQSYTAAYAKLYEELYAVTHNAYNRVSLMSGGTYRLNSRSNTSSWMSVNDENKTIGEAANTTDTKQDWVFEATGTEDVYYIKNVNTSRYLAGATKNVQVTTTDTKAEAKGYKATMVEAGVWTLQCQDSKLQFLNRSGGTVLGWNEGNDTNSQWYITTVSVEQTAEKLYELQALVQKTKELIDEMAVVTPMQKHTLQTTSLSSPLYLSTNACHNTLNNANDGQGLAGLLDEDVATYFHSDWGNKVNETHYLQVDLGEAHSFSDFIFCYTTRDNGNNCPTTIEVSGSNDGSSFSDPLYTFTGLPTEGGQTWESPILSAAEGYRYLRFMVTAAEGGHRYFVMSRFGISECKATVQSMGEEYVAQSLTSDALIAAYASIHSAQDKMKVGGATLDELTSLYNELSPKYAALEDIYNEAKNAAFTAKKAELLTLRNNTTSLISSCGTVTYTPATLDGALALQTTNSEGDFYLSTNAQEPNEGPIKNLLTSENTYFHSKWSAAVGAFHHLKVDMGEGYSLKDFTFTYKTSNGLFPYIIKVYGSNDTNDTGTLLYTFSKEDNTNALPDEASTSWTSSTISSDTRYRYIRFDVVESGGGGLKPTPTGATSGTEYCFKMSYFGLTAIGTPESYTVELGNDAGGATEELLLAAYKQNQEAQVSYDVATTESQLQKAIDKLQADYDALSDAKNSTTYTDYTIQVTGGNGNGGVVYGDANYTTTLNAPATLTVDQLTAIPLDGYVAKSVTLEGTTITVIYNKVYTVQVVGVDGLGGVTYGDNAYADGDTIHAATDITVDQLTAQAVDGYNEGVVSIADATITVTYTMTPLVDTEKYYTLRCWDGSAHGGRFISDDGTVINGHSTEGTLFRFEAANNENGYYIKSYVSDKYLNVDGTSVVVSTEKETVWTMEASSHTSGAMTLTIGNDNYLNNNGGASNSCPYLWIKYHSGGPGSGAYCSLWKLTEGTPLDKSALNTLIGATNTLIESCYTDEEFNYAGSLNVTEELVTATRDAVAAAQEKYDSKATTESEYEAALNALQTARDNLQTAINYAELPVQLTFDANTPVTYKIAIDRSASSVLAYDQNSAMVAVSDFKLGNKAHGWYFMPATDGKVYIMPYYDDNTTLALSTNSFSEGNSKVKGMAVGSDGYTQGWTITNVNMDEANRNAGWYNITCTSNGTDTWYFSNHGGVANKMGFLNDANDGGSRFKFEQITFDKSEAYYTLYNYYMSDTKVASNTITGNDAVGYYPVDAANAYNTAYGTATTVLEDATATDEDYTNAYNALVAANEALVINMPEEGKYYTIVSACNDHRNGQLMYATSENAIVFSREMTNVKPEALWKFTAEGYLENLQTGCGVSTGSTGGSHHKLGESSRVVSIKSISLDGQVLLTPQDAQPLHAQDNGSVVVGWGAYDAGSASAWRIVEVDMANVKFDMTIGQYGHAGLYLNYSVLIPKEVKAYIIDGSDVEIENGEGSLTLKQIEGSVLPAKTAVILEAEPYSYSFYYTENEANVGTNLLTGSAYQTYCEAETNHNYYIFGHKEGVVGLYKNSVVYDATGAESNTHYKMSANKVLFDWDNLAGNVNAFRFRIDGEETGIEEVTVGAEDTIYDLYGRRLAEVTTSGLYIVNGEKRYVKVK